FVWLTDPIEWRRVFFRRASLLEDPCRETPFSFAGTLSRLDVGVRRADARRLRQLRTGAEARRAAAFAQPGIGAAPGAGGPRRRRSRLGDQCVSLDRGVRSRP